ncbi:hypothetical protein CLOSTHATH_01402 [Hungatella hathewayi DSM 13479]|uniref:Uncharacterized protein n=1 Tax=Hungatella hathewayi DSM 13479 TaxID=566550 RepID=D3ACS4_9FIRM|nr:hypothetical protein CLOSTHATH_01402 [Hungatella hathewayi DSM 13479]
MRKAANGFSHPCSLFPAISITRNRRFFLLLLRKVCAFYGVAHD